MIEAYVCRWCKGPPLPEPPEGECPNCRGFYRHNRVRLPAADCDGALTEPLREGEPISGDALFAEEEEANETKRVTGLAGVDWVFDGGLPRVGVILLACKEGSGKTTWSWQLGRHYADKLKLKVLYQSSEQTPQGLRRQFKRLGELNSRFLVHCAEDKEVLFRQVEQEQPDLWILDSVHHVTGVMDDGDFNVASGGQRAVTIVAKEASKLAEELGMLVILIGHMTNDGDMAGGSHLRHAVDATLTLTRTEDKRDPHRILEFWGKSRFGDATRRALYIMHDKGLIDQGPLTEDSAQNG